ncbi:MAG: DUF2914 domain-containing protein [Pseudomonadales bacterium]|nr:DUF2914 domain-containing protein [Pseudomonadales bacterium]
MTEENDQLQSQKLNIRIQLPQKEVEPEETTPAYTETILWGRIVGASTALVVMLILVIGGGFYYLSEDKTNMQNTVAFSDISSNKLRDINNDNQAIEPLVVKSTESAETISSPNKIIAKKDTSTIQSSSPFQHTKSEIFSNHIKRFVISQQVKNKEPIGSIDDIKFDHNNIAKIYAYSDAVNLKDQTLYYRWTLNGKKIAVVKIGVWSNRWRSYSSKFIQPHMQGDWMVELQNAKGETLALNQFSF